MTGLTDGEAALNACAQLQRATAVEGLHGIAGHVQGCLNEQLGIGMQRRNAWIVIPGHVHAGRRFRAQQRAHPLRHFVDIDAALVGYSPGSQHAIEQILQAIGLVDDDLGVLLEGIVGEFPLQELRGAAKAPQGIADLMGQAAHQRAHRGVAGDALLVPGDAPLAVHCHELHQEPRPVAALADWRHAAIHADGLCRKREGHLALGEGRAAGGGPAKGGGEQRGLGKQPFGAFAEHLIGTQVQQLFCGRIHGQQAQIRAEQQHRRGEVVDDGLGAVHGLALNLPDGRSHGRLGVGSGYGHVFH